MSEELRARLDAAVRELYASQVRPPWRVKEPRLPQAVRLMEHNIAVLRFLRERRKSCPWPRTPTNGTRDWFTAPLPGSSPDRLQECPPLPDDQARGIEDRASVNSVASTETDCSTGAKQ